MNKAIGHIHVHHKANQEPFSHFILPVLHQILVVIAIPID